MAENRVQIIITTDGKGAVTGIQQVQGEFKKLETSGAKAAQTVGNSFRDLKQTIIGAFAFYEIQKALRDLISYGMKVETLGIAMQQVGKNAGYTADVLNFYVQQVKAAGIATAEAQSTITKAITSGLPLEKMKQLATAARDIAVIAGKNTSEVFASLMHGIESHEIEIFRTLGVQIGLQEKIFDDYAKTLGKTAKQLTETQKNQAYLNAVLEYGAKVAGAAAAADESAGKQLASMDRYIKQVQEDLYGLFSASVSGSVRTFNAALQDLDKYLKANEVEITAIGIEIGDFVVWTLRAAVGAGQWAVQNKVLLETIIGLYAIAKLSTIIETFIGFLVTLTSKLGTAAAAAVALKVGLGAIAVAAAAAGVGLYKTLKGETGYTDYSEFSQYVDYGHPAGMEPEPSSGKTMITKSVEESLDYEGRAQIAVAKLNRKIADALKAKEQDASVVAKRIQEEFAKLDPKAKKGAKAASPLDLSDIDQQVNRYHDKIAGMYKELSDLNYDFWILQAKNSGDYYRAEELQISKWAEGSIAAIWEQVTEGQRMVDELYQKLMAAKGGATTEAWTKWWEMSQKQAELAAAAAQKEIATLNIVAEKQKELGKQRLQDAETLTSLNKQYVELTGTVQQRYEAEILLTQATLERNKIEAKTPEIAAAYEKLAKEQMRLADVWAHGSLWDGMVEGFREISRQAETISQIGKEITLSLKSEFSTAFKDIVKGTKSVGEALSDMGANIFDKISEKFADKAFNDLFSSLSGAVGKDSTLGSLLSSVTGSTAKGSSGLLGASSVASMAVTANLVTISGGSASNLLSGLTGGNYGTGGMSNTDAMNAWEGYSADLHSQSSSILSSINTGMSELTSSIGTSFNSLFSFLGSGFSSVFSSLGSAFSGGGSSGGIFGSLFKGLGSLFSGGGGGFNEVGFWDTMYSGTGPIIGMAGGGTIAEPIIGLGASGRKYRFGEGGIMEDVVPRNGRDSGSRRVNVTNHFHFPKGTDVRSFKKSQGQIMADMNLAARQAERNL